MQIYISYLDIHLIYNISIILKELSDPESLHYNKKILNFYNYFNISFITIHESLYSIMLRYCYYY